MPRSNWVERSDPAYLSAAEKQSSHWNRHTHVGDRCVSSVGEIKGRVVVEGKKISKYRVRVLSSCPKAGKYTIVDSQDCRGSREDAVRIHDSLCSRWDR